MAHLRGVAARIVKIAGLLVGVASVLGLLVFVVLFVASRFFDGDARVDASQETCNANGSASQMAGVPDEARRTAMVAAWIMGTRAGAHASITVLLRGRPSGGEGQTESWTNLQAQADNALAAVTRMTSRLNAPQPAPFAPSDATRAIIEFAPFVESAQHQTAVALSKGYAPQICEAYKLGLYWGFSTPYRGNDPGARNVLAPEIALYADRLKLSENLKTAMMGPSRARDFAKVMAEGEQIFKNGGGVLE